MHVMGIDNKDARYKMTKLLLDKGANVHLQSSEDDTAMSLASRAGHCELVSLLESKMKEVSDERCV